MPNQRTEDHASPLSAFNQFAVLRQQHARLQVEREHMVVNVKRNIIAGYQQKLGAHDNAFKRAGWQVSRLKREVELLRTQAMQGDVDYDRITARLEAEFDAQQRQLEEAVRQIDWAKQRMKSMMTFEQTQVFQARYRKVVGLLHPDIRFSPSAAADNLLVRAREAFATGDAAELEAIEILAEGLPKENAAEQPVAEVEERVNRLKTANQTAIDEIATLRTEWPFPLAAKLPDENWLQAQRVEYEAKTAALLKERDRLRTELNQLLDGRS